MDTQTCTRCRHARLWTITPPRNPSSPFEIKKGWITCDFREGNASRESGAPFSNAFPESSEICDIYEEINKGKFYDYLLGEHMKKYNTRPIGYTGCHPVIAEHLKRGEAIECWVWNNRSFSEKVVGIVTGYEVDGEYPYRIGPTMNSRYAEPIAHKTSLIMPPERAIPTLIAKGWKYNKEGALVGDPPIVPQMFQEMGGPIDNSRAVWPPCIIEEVEDDE